MDWAISDGEDNVVMGGEYKDWSDVKNDIPQGSGLGMPVVWDIHQ